MQKIKIFILIYSSFFSSAPKVYEATVKNDIPKIVKILSGFNPKGTVIAGYEAGCMGYTLQRNLTASKIECRVISPNKVSR